MLTWQVTLLKTISVFKHSKKLIKKGNKNSWGISAPWHKFCVVNLGSGISILTNIQGKNLAAVRSKEKVWWFLRVCSNLCGNS